MGVTGFIGGRDFEEVEVLNALEEARADGNRVLTGSARGLERFVADNAAAMGLEVEIEPLNEDMYGDNAAEMQALAILTRSDAVHVWKSGRGRLARSVAERTFFLNPPLSSWYGF